MPLNYDVEWPKLQRECGILRQRDTQNLQMIDQFRTDLARAEYIRKQQIILIKKLQADALEMAEYIDNLPQRGVNKIGSGM